jgi:hypothetical protein
MSSQIRRWLAAWSVILAVASNAGAQRPLRFDREAKPWTPEEFIAKLDQIVHIDNQYDGTLESIARLLADQMGVTVLHDEKAFKDADPPLDNVQTTKVHLPIMHHVRVETVFRQLLDPLGGTLLIRGDHFLISTVKEAMRRSELGPLPTRFADDDDEAVVPLWTRGHNGLIVHCTFDGQPLRGVVTALAARYPEYRIELSNQVGVRDRARITGTLINLPLSDVCREIAEAAGLQTVDTANGTLITTPVHAADLRQREEARQRQALLARYAIASAPPSLYQSTQPLSRRNAVNWNDYAQQIRNRQTAPANGE